MGGGVSTIHPQWTPLVGLSISQFLANNNAESIYILQSYTVRKGVQVDQKLVELWGWLLGGVGGGRFTTNPISPPILCQIGRPLA
jgi:hypothetical protein